MAIQLPGVQTRLAQKLVEKLEESIDGEVSFSSVSVYPFRTVVLRDLLIRDSHPYVDFHGCCQDTVLWAGYISANLFNIRSLLDGDGIHLSNVSVRDGVLNLVVEPWGEDMPKPKRDNLSRVFGFQKDKYELVDGQWCIRQKEAKEQGRLFDATTLCLENFRFTLRNHVKDKHYPEGCINWSDMDASNIYIKGHKIAFGEGIMSAIVDKVSFSEKSGYSCRSVSGSVRVGEGQTIMEDIKIDDEWSKIRLESLVLSYETARAWKYFPQQVRIDGDIARSSLSLRSLGFFVRSLLGMTLMTEVKGKVGGYVDELNLSELALTFQDAGVDALLSGELIGLPKFESMVCDLTAGLKFSTEGLEQIIRDKSPSLEIGLDRYAPGTEFSFDGTLSGPLDELSVSGNIASDAGSLSAGLMLRNLIDKECPLQLSGKLGTLDLDVGHIVGIDWVHALTMRADLSVCLGEAATLDIDTVFVDRLNLLGYDYSGIVAAGEYSEGSFNGKLICSDPNLNFLFQGIITPSKNTKNAVYKFYVNLGYADLHAIGLDGRELSKMSVLVNANFTRVNETDMLGEIDLRGLQLQDMRGKHDIGDISISSHVNDNINRMRLDSRFLEASFVGSGGLGSFIKDLKDRLVGAEFPMFTGQTVAPWSGHYYDFDLEMHDSRDVLSFFKSGLYVADSTSLTLKIGSDGSVDGGLSSHRIASGKKYLKNIKLEFDSVDDMLLARLSADEFNWPPLNTRDNGLTLMLNDNQLGLGFSYENSNENKGELYLTANICRDEEDSLMLSASVLPSALMFNSMPWEISDAEIVLSGSGASINGLEIASAGQSFRVDGGLSRAGSDTLSVRMDSIDISVLSPFVGDNMALAGMLTGHGEIISSVDRRKAVALSLLSEGTEIAGREAGALNVNGKWDMEANGFRFTATNDISGKATLTAGGLYVPERKNLGLRVRLDSLDLGYASPLLSSVFSETAGSLSGEFRVQGPTDALEISSTMASVNEGMLRLAYTNVPYRVNGFFNIGPQGLRFSDTALSIQDSYGNSGSLSGGIEWDKLKDMKLDIHASLSGMEVLNTTQDMNPSFYGNVFASGNADVTGPLNALLIDLDVTTVRNSQVYIPLSGAASATSTDLLTFTRRVSNSWIDPYEVMMQSQESEEKAANDMQVKLKLQVNQGVQAFLDMGSNALNGRGSGHMDIEVQPSRDVFSLNGSYAISSGNFHFSVLDIVSRDFEIEDGSTVHFGGELMDSELDIHALYKTRASVATLISDTTSTASRRQVECGIGLSGRLKNPQLEFSIDIPDLDPTTQARVQSALNTEDKVQKQFLALLVSNSFIPDESSGIVNNSSLLVSNVTEVMANQLNNILQKLDIPLDFGLDYGQSSSGTGVFDVAVSTDLFNSRVIVNGSLGNTDYGNSSSGNVAGDIDVEIKLDRAGALRLTLFSHSADQYTNYLDNSQRNGGGLSYQRNFDNFHEFFRTLFNGRKKRQEAERLRQEAQRDEEKTRMTIAPSSWERKKKSKK